jgi:2-dehydro-3-deoxyphosphogluconate aldolase/(4S)-4-hydroxy-2-oxoglutarate aldolase
MEAGHPVQFAPRANPATDADQGATRGTTIAKKEQAVRCIEEIGIIPGIRVACAEDALFAAEALCAGGIPIVEITMTVPSSAEVLAEVASKHPEVIAGAGTVWDVEMAHRCVDAGAMFLTSPGVDAEVGEFARKRNLVAITEALTPTEALRAWKAGADFVRIFPCSLVGGPLYIKALRGPHPEVRFIAAGGVNQITVADFILAGASAVGILSDLIHPEAIQCRQRERIRELSRRFVRMVKQARKAPEINAVGRPA